jgi:hypothetical protein
LRKWDISIRNSYLSWLSSHAISPLYILSSNRHNSLSTNCRFRQLQFVSRVLECRISKSCRRAETQIRGKKAPSDQGEIPIFNVQWRIHSKDIVTFPYDCWLKNKFESTLTLIIVRFIKIRSSRSGLGMSLC